MTDVEEFLKDWRKNNNTEDAVYASYHIDAMEAYAENLCNQRIDKALNNVAELLPNGGKELIELAKSKITKD